MMQFRDMLNPTLAALGEDVMGFLNEVQLNYPEAISFASGRPDEQFFSLEQLQDYFDLYVATTAARQKTTTKEVLGRIGQYGRTKGIVNEEVARWLSVDENIHVKPEDILMTVGTQEAIVLAITALCDREKDVILFEDPTYVGIAHFSILAGYCGGAVPVGPDGISLRKLEEEILRQDGLGRRVKLVYVIPDHQNPTGCTMPLENRLQLLQLAEQYDFFILEDNAYGEFLYEGVPLPALKALDSRQRVIYLRSFSKTLFPSLRLAALVTDAKVRDEKGAVALSDVLALVKGYVTVNSSALNQAALGGLLLSHQYSLREFSRPKVAGIRFKPYMLLRALEAEMGNLNFPEAFSWNSPSGGFFIRIALPFNVDRQDVIACAEKFGVIFTPMSFFYFNGGGQNEIRLAFSNVSPEEIKTGIGRLAGFLVSKLTI